MTETPDPRPELDLSLFGDEHVRRYEETNGAEGYTWNGAPIAILTTTGRKIFGQDGDTYLLVASKGGAPSHPAWYLNLRDNPDVELQVKGDKFSGRARLATPDEKHRLWQIMLEHWPYYDDYQARTERDIPVVVIERA